MTRPLVIVEHPWGQLPDPIRHSYLTLCIQDCHRRGESPVASVATYVLTHALDDLKPEERAQGTAGGLEWYRVAEKAVVYTDYGISAGMQQGMARAIEAGVPVEVRQLWPTQAALPAQP